MTSWIARVGLDGGPVVVLGSRDRGAAEATVDDVSFSDVPELLEAAGGEWSRIEPGAPLPTRDEIMLSVVGRPRKILCVGLNYAQHAAEGSSPVPAYPMLFPKWSTALAGPYADISLPPESSQVDWEAELAFVIGRRCRRVSREEASGVVFGYTAANDVSMRDFQLQTSQMAPGKSWDRATPLGPVIVPSGECGGATPDLALTGSLNGQMVQDARTSELVFSPADLIAYITTWMTLEPGDVVLTGTPSGVGLLMQPPRLLREGDVFEVTIERVGTLRNRFTAESVGG